MLATSASAAGALPVVQVYKSPSCGCCEQWVAHMKANGFVVVAHNTDDVAAHKARLGVPPAQGSGGAPLGAVLRRA